MAFEYDGIRIEWYGHASFRLSDGKIEVYIDPYLLPEDAKKADIIMVTHGHYDHCAVENIHDLLKDDTTIVATSDCASKLCGVNIRLVKPWENLEIKGVRIKTVPAYNLDKPFHPKSNEWVGYIITLNDVRIYHAGDTDFVPEMRDIKVDIALLPVGGTYTMDAKEAAKAVETFKPRVAIPMHFGSIVGNEKDAEEFRKLVKGVRVEII